MQVTWDPAKRLVNIAKHGVDFVAVGGFEWEAALVRADVRFDYGEPRLVAMAPIEQRLHGLVFTVEGRTVRVISLRKANNKEIDRYERTV